MNQLKVTDMWTILEEKRLSIDGVVDKYLEVWETLQFHKFEQFRKNQNFYMPTCVR